MAERGPLMVITGGGTGGHVYPGLAVAAALSAGDPPARVLYVGSKGGMEADLVARAGLPFRSVASGALLGRGRLAQLASAIRLSRGTLEAVDIMRHERVTAVLATGGYVSAPVVIGAWLAGTPAMIYLPDVEPGLAVKFLSRFARRVAVTSEHSQRFLPARKVVVTGYPIRPELAAADRAGGRAQLRLPEGDRVVLVLGGSRGAHSINVALAVALPDLLRRAIVVHSSGPQDEPWLRQVAADLPADLRPRYRLAAYLYEDLAPVMAAADLAISRAGASVMGEYPFFGLPSVLVPYPYAGAHQERNADYLVAKGAAIKLLDRTVREGGLLPVVLGLLDDGPGLARMAAAVRELARPNAAAAIAKELLSLCSKA